MRLAGRELRPLWQMPLMLLYLVATKYCAWVENWGCESGWDDEP